MSPRNSDKKMLASDEINSSIGKQIRKARRENNVTIDELAQKLAVESRLVHSYEAGEDRIPSAHLVQIASVLKYDPDWFLPDTPYQHAGHENTISDKRKEAGSLLYKLSTPEELDTTLKFLRSLLGWKEF